MSESELLVRRINDGTVIDHIDEGKGLHVLSAMGIDGKDGGLTASDTNSCKISAVRGTRDVVNQFFAHM